jgi:hypothetical protein
MRSLLLVESFDLNGWLINITAGQHVWRTVKEARFNCLHTQNLNQDPLENTFGDIRSYCICNSNPTVGQFVDEMTTSIVNGLAYRGLCGMNCEDDGVTLLDNLLGNLILPPQIPLQVTASCH